MTSRPLFYPREGGCNALWMTPEACGLWGLLDVLILTAASRPFFLAALRELRLDSAAAVSGRGRPRSGCASCEKLWRSGEFRGE